MARRTRTCRRIRKIDLIQKAAIKLSLTERGAPGEMLLLPSAFK